jgi:hypothetical protein
MNPAWLDFVCSLGLYSIYLQKLHKYNKFRNVGSHLHYNIQLSDIIVVWEIISGVHKELLGCPLDWLNLVKRQGARLGGVPKALRWRWGVLCYSWN